MSALLRLHWARHRLVFLFLAIGLFVFQWLITRMAPGPEQARLMQELFDLIPGPLGSMFGNELSSLLTPVGFIAFGYSHPFALTLLGTWVIRVPAGALSGEIGAGTMDLLASRRVPRAEIVGAALLVTLSGLVLLLGAALLGTAAGLNIEPVAGVGPFTFIRVVASCGLMFAAFGAITLAISAIRRTSGAAIGMATALVAGSFALDYVARAWEPLGWARPLSLFSYYSRAGLLQTDMPWGDVAILGGVGITAAVAAFLIFGRRDL